jgi:glycogen debranching enzyme
MIALGMSRYDIPKPVMLKLFSALFNASIFTELHRLPELYCGFRRQPGEGPTLYPVACSPQAWAAGSVFMMLQASLGLTLDAVRGKLWFNHPTLPDWLGELTIRGLRVGNGQLDLDIRRHVRDVEINVVNRKGDVQVIVTK